ncbi:putative periplasmic serine endoprotease DegP-like precursor [Planctomycetes bacterium CA13]|uniref:Putative periplasmic serine endoprotease DegP-like n=1 Tax=Novipirellula herctigrandis TaxID=2527986 RepID=A0A5C5Z6U1_9BACT|nr:putative periplasmic serine endoprotease DegP-like precursor [Planctomycetes bacterium CA13]
MNPRSDHPHESSIDPLDESDYVNDFQELRFDSTKDTIVESGNLFDTDECDLTGEIRVATKVVPPPVHRLTPASDESEKPAEGDKSLSQTGSQARGSDPIVQSLMLLTTMAVMLAAARFAVPQIVEEIRYAWHRGELRAEYDTGNEGLKNVSLDSLSEAYQMVTAAVGPSVVHINVSRHSEPDHGSIAKVMRSEALMVADQGSGVVVDKAGYLVTNRHVIMDGEDIQVTLSDGRRVEATVVGTDLLTDVAVLKVSANSLMPIVWGDSDRCRVGSPVWAVGSPFGLDRTVTFGILSGKHRMVRASTQYQDFMQSDVAVNPGNSGGPLVDSRGRLVGINTAIVGDTYQGVSFSIPSNVVRQVYERLKTTGKVERGWLGVGLADVEDDQLIGSDARIRGAMVSAVTDSKSPAARAGLKVGDLIVGVNGQPIADVGHLMRMIGDSTANTVVEVEFYRRDEKIKVPVRLGVRPEL